MKQDNAVRNGELEHGQFLYSSIQISGLVKVLYTSMADLFSQKPSQLLWEVFRHMLQLMHKDCSYTYPPLCIARNSFVQLSELEQCRVKKLAQGFNTAAQDSNPGSLSWESEAYEF